MSIQRNSAAVLLLSPLLLVSCAAPPAEPAGPAPGTLAYDKDVWHWLLENHAKVRREVSLIENGVAAVTESDDPETASKIRDHALAMQARMKTGSRVRVWDPLFVELFEKHDKITLTVTPTDKGVRIVETSDDPRAVELLRAHAAGVTDFVREGFDAAGRETPMPGARAGE